MEVRAAETEGESGPELVLKGSFDGQRDILEFWRAVALEGLLEEVVRSLDKLVDAAGSLRLRFGVKEAAAGSMVLTRAGNAVEVTAVPEGNAGDPTETVAAAREALEAVAGMRLGEGATHVVTAFVTHRGRVLVLRRSEEVGTYRGRWAGVSGYLEGEERPVDRARQEIAEELGLHEVTLLQAGRPLLVLDGERAWVVHPFAFASETRKIVLDWESTEARWVPPEALASLDTVPGLAEAYDRVSQPTPGPR
jgi:ADP-ribose pyrophosphatase YjhB (NUDIX family)/RNA binding exosome subunit